MQRSHCSVDAARNAARLVDISCHRDMRLSLPCKSRILSRVRLRIRPNTTPTYHMKYCAAAHRGKAAIADGATVHSSDASQAGPRTQLGPPVRLSLRYQFSDTQRVRLLLSYSRAITPPEPIQTAGTQMAIACDSSASRRRALAHGKSSFLKRRRVVRCPNQTVFVSDRSRISRFLPTPLASDPQCG